MGNFLVHVFVMYDRFFFHDFGRRIEEHWYVFYSTVVWRGYIIDTQDYDLSP